MLAGLEILSKVFDQQSSSTVSKILQQVRGIWGHSSGSPHHGGHPQAPPWHRPWEVGKLWKNTHHPRLPVGS